MSHGPEMTAVRVHGPGDLRVDRVPDPVATPGSVLVRVLAVGVCATDRKIAARGAAGPLVLGHEIVGEVVPEAGSAAGSLPHRVVVAPNVGCGECWQCLRGSPNYCLENRAFGIHVDGGMAEFLLVPERAVAAGHLLDVPAELGDVDAALVEPLACCVESLTACSLAPGESVLIVGGGVMGRLHVTLAKALGAGTVVIVDRHEERLAHAARLGADLCVLDAGNGLEDSLAEQAATANPHPPGGFDVVIVTVGQAAAVAAGQRLLATAGRLNVFGGLPKSEPELTLDGNTLHYRNQAVLGTTGASMSSLRRAIQLLAAGELNITGLVSAEYPLSEASAAFAAAGSVDHARVVLVTGPAGDVA